MTRLLTPHTLSVKLKAVPLAPSTSTCLNSPCYSVWRVSPAGSELLSTGFLRYQRHLLSHVSANLTNVGPTFTWIFWAPFWFPPNSWGWDLSLWLLSALLCSPHSHKTLSVWCLMGKGFHREKIFRCWVFFSHFQLSLKIMLMQAAGSGSKQRI